MHSIFCAQVSFAAQLDTFLTQVRKQREQLLDLSADVQLQVRLAGQARHVALCRKHMPQHTICCIAHWCSERSSGDARHR
jgi:hypothetical protein